MPSSGIIDLAIGLAFVFGVTAALSSVVTELIARFLGLRGAYLLRGLRELLDGEGTGLDLGQAQQDYADMKALMRGDAPAGGAGNPAPAAAAPAAPAAAAPAAPSATNALLGGPILRSQGMTGQISGRTLTLTPPGQTGRPAKLAASAGGHLWRQCRSLPSYIPARSFAEAVVDLVVPTAEGQTTMSTIRQSVNALPGGSMSTLKSSLQALAKSADDDISVFRSSVEHWYDDHMDRVSGWYKRHVAKITLVVGAILVLLLNINALTIGRTLYTDSTVNTAVSAVAAKSTSCPPSQDPQSCLASLQEQLSAAAQAGLPIGWGTVRDCVPAGTSCNWLDQRGIFSRHGGSPWQAALVLIGFLMTIVALVPGARFWFGLLSKLGSMRTTGPKPAS
jgi:hypothetical protein